MDDNTKTPATPQRGEDVCPQQGQAWTCTIQCGGGTRSQIERLFNAPGVEACVVTHCSCELVVQPPPVFLGQPPEVTDAQLPLALVVFGAAQLLKARP